MNAIGHRTQISTGFDTNLDGVFDRVENDTDADGTVNNIAYHQHTIEGQAVFTDADNNGHFDTLQVLPGSDFTPEFSYTLAAGTVKGIVGLGDIILSSEGAAELSFNSEFIKDITDGDTDHKVKIQGGTDDKVNLNPVPDPSRADRYETRFVERDDNGDGTQDSEEIDGINYNIYGDRIEAYGVVAGNILIQVGVEVGLDG